MADILYDLLLGKADKPVPLRATLNICMWD